MPSTPEQVWQRLVDESGEDEIERAGRASVAQAERELRQAGFDVKKERAEADAWLKELTREAAPDESPKDDAADSDPGEAAAWVSVPPPASRHASSARWTLLLAAALA